VSLNPGDQYGMIVIGFDQIECFRARLALKPVTPAWQAASKGGQI